MGALQLSTDILMHLAHSDACKQRMHALRLESVLDRLVLTEEGVVRDHALKVLYVLRDKSEVKECALKIIQSVNHLREVSAKYGVSTTNSSSLHKQMAVWLTAKMRDNAVEVSRASSLMRYMRACLPPAASRSCTAVQGAGAARPCVAMRCCCRPMTPQLTRTNCKRRGPGSRRVCSSTSGTA